MDESTPWSCRICSSKALPAAYTHCPNCSHERDWDADASAGALAANSPSRFEGDTYACCAHRYTAEARFCGSCGARLRQRRRLFPERRLRPSAAPFHLLGDEEEQGPTLVPFLALEWLLQEG